MPEILKDPKIEVTPEQAKLIGEVICHEITESRKLGEGSNGDVYKLAKRCENQYAQVTKWMEKGKECDEPWRGAADFFIGLTEWIIDAVWARIVKTIFSQDPWMVAEPLDGASSENTENVTEFVDTMHKSKIKIYSTYKFFMKQMLKLPIAVVKYCWESDYDRMIVREQALVFSGPNGEVEYIIPDTPDAQTKMLELMANGYQQTGQEDVWAAKDRELYEGPRLRYIPFEDYVWCPETKKENRRYWEGDRFWLTINEMILKVQQNKFLPEPVEELRKTLVSDGMSNQDVAIKTRSELNECYHWYGRLPFNKNNEIDLIDGDTIEQEVHCIVEFKNQKLLQINHWEYERVPHPERVYIVGRFEETEGFVGRSLAQKIYMCQKEVNALHNMIMNNAALAINKIFVKRRTLTGEEWEKPEVCPGAIWEEDMPGDIRVLEVGDVKAVAWELEQSFLNFAERISNISIYQTGTARTTGGNKTLGEVESTIQEGNLGMDKFVESCYEILGTISSWTQQYYSEQGRMPPNMERPLNQESGQKVFPSQQTMGMYQEKGINPYWSDQDISGKFHFVGNGTTLNSNRNWQIMVANDLQDRLMPMPMVSGNMLATWEILKKVITSRGIQDWQKYLPTREAIIQEMKLLAAKAQAQQAMDQQEGTVVPQAIEKATQAGVPPEAAKELAMKFGGK